MILSDREMQVVKESIEAQAGLDEELMRLCGPLVHMEKCDEALRSAFVLLEKRLRAAVKNDTMTGTQLANHAFSPKDGPLAKQLGRTQEEREGLRELFAGAFKLFRNPTAHGAAAYSAAEGKALLGLVHLMLGIVGRANELPSPQVLPENVKSALLRAEEIIGPSPASRLRVFLGKCMTAAGLRTTMSARNWLPFRRHALYKPPRWDRPRPHGIPVFYLVAPGPRIALHFSTSAYSQHVPGFRVEQLLDELQDLGSHPVGRLQEPRIDLQLHNDQAFFDAMLDVVLRVVRELEETLQAGWPWRRPAPHGRLRAKDRNPSPRPPPP